MRISDWSSDVCSSDLLVHGGADVGRGAAGRGLPRCQPREVPHQTDLFVVQRTGRCRQPGDVRFGRPGPDQGADRPDQRGATEVSRKSVVAGKKGYGLVNLGGRRISKIKKV